MDFISLRCKRFSCLFIVWLVSNAKPSISFSSRIVLQKKIKTRNDVSQNRHLLVVNYATRLSKNLLYSKPLRTEGNAEGILYVNDRCINCAACSNFAPATFKRSTSAAHHIVSQQPTAIDEIQNARAALEACPVSAIRCATSKTELSTTSDSTKKPLTLEQKQLANQFATNLPLPFPRILSKNVWYLGHHSEASFGAMPYLVQGNYGGKRVSIMVDVPRCSKPAIHAVQSLLPDNTNAPDYMLLTHVDDTANHQKWIKVFPKMKRIFHSGDLGPYNWIGDTSLENVETLLRGTSFVKDGELLGWSLDGVPVKIHCGINKTASKKPFNLSGLLSKFPINDENHMSNNNNDNDNTVDVGDFLIIHTPGHSPGSISLLFYPVQNSAGGGTLFTGDTYSFTTRNGGHMTGFPGYGNDLLKQAATIKCLERISNWWSCIAPGHGHVRSYKILEDQVSQKIIKRKDTEVAIKELIEY